MEVRDTINRLREDGVTMGGTARLLLDAVKGKLIRPDDGSFRVRTSADPECHPLYFAVAIGANGEPLAIYLDFEPLRIGNSVVELEDATPVRVPDKTDSNDPRVQPRLRPRAVDHVDRDHARCSPRGGREPEAVTRAYPGSAHQSTLGRH